MASDPAPPSGSTTVKLSVATRDRIRSYGGATHEDTIIEALDALDAQRFWSRAEAAAAWRAGLPVGERRRLDERDAAVDRAFEDIG